ncbi:MAG: hypothetical protein HQK54_06315 [Oligoflexales bacterium]|nr:hypothetical protein [Oligoflexales bacterium]
MYQVSFSTARVVSNNPPCQNGLSEHFLIPGSSAAKAFSTAAERISNIGIISGSPMAFENVSALTAGDEQEPYLMTTETGEQVVDGTKMITDAEKYALMTLDRQIGNLRNRDPETLEELKLFFGRHISREGAIAGLKIIRNHLTGIAENSDYVFDQSDWGDGALAYVEAVPSVTVERSDSSIYLKRSFFSLPINRRANVLVHETAHLALGTVDRELNEGITAYRVPLSAALAQQDELAASDNADNWANFIDPSYDMEDFKLVKQAVRDGGRLVVVRQDAGEAEKAG